MPKKSNKLRAIKSATILACCLSLTVPAHAFDFMELIMAWFGTMQRTSAAKANATATATAANVDAQTKVSATAAQTSAESAVTSANRIVDATINYGNVTGPLPSLLLCGRAQQEEATAQTKVQAIKYTQRVTNNWLNDESVKAGLPRENVLEESKQVHDDNYCTIAESQNGQCETKPNGMQGADIDYAIAFRDMTMHEPQEFTANAFISNVVADTVAADPLMYCGTPDCKWAKNQYLTLAARGAAITSALTNQVAERRATLVHASSGAVKDNLPPVIGNPSSSSGGTPSNNPIFNF